MVAALCGVAGIAGAARAARSQEPVRRIALDEAVTLFARNSLELRIARTDAARDAARARQAAAYPNPVAGVTHERLSGDGPGYDETYVLLSQQLRWPWESVARGRVASVEREAGAHRVARDSLRLAFEMKRAFIEAASAENLRDGLEEATGLVRVALQDAAHRVTEGDLSGYALRRLRVERARYESELSDATLAMHAARRRLAAFLVPDGDAAIAPTGFPSGNPPDLPAAPPPPGPEIPALAAAAAALHAAQADEQAVRHSRIPAPAATAGYKSQRDGLAGVFLGVALPLPLFDRRGAAAAEAAAATASAEAHLALARRLVDNDLRLTVEAYQAARERFRLFTSELLTDLEGLLRIARMAYAEGEMSLVELLDAVDAFRTARVTAVNAHRDLWVTYFDVERAAGGAPAGPRGDR
jgi:cobalt-zinc-cadmium efflux system outer membrane protein